MADDRREPVRQAVGSAGQSAEAGIARQFSELARELQADNSQQALLTHIVRAAVTEVPGAEHAGITLLTSKQFITAVASDELVERIDRVQYQTDEGPCLDSARHHETVRSDDLRAEGRWPRFAPQAAGLGVLSILSIQLFVVTSMVSAIAVRESATSFVSRHKYCLSAWRVLLLWRNGEDPCVRRRCYWAFGSDDAGPARPFSHGC